MKVTLLPSSTGAWLPYQYLTTFLIEAEAGMMAVDAGSLGLSGSPAEQTRVRHVLLTHSHIDHLASLPFFLENVATPGVEPPTIWGLAATLDSLQRDIFNDRLFPDFVQLSSDKLPLIRLAPVTPLQPWLISGFEVTAVPVNHVVPTLAYRIAEPNGVAVLIVTDTGPTEAVWELARATPELRAIFLEVTFPNAMGWLAAASKHFTPETFQAELIKAPPDVPVYAMHLKPRCRDTIIAEMAGLTRVRLMEPGTAYEF